MPDGSDSEESTRNTSGWLGVEIVRDAGDWGAFAPAEVHIEAAANALGAHARFRDQTRAAAACVALSDDASVRRLNATYRSKDKPTNVLSFPAQARGNGTAEGPRMLGDVVLAEETVLQEASNLGIAPADHLEHLVIHGLLHLLGFDHEEDGEAAVMERLETEILSARGISDPYSGPVAAKAAPAREKGRRR